MVKTPNIIFIVFDTMRSDSISVYNKNRITPNFEVLSKESIIFSKNIAPAPWTIPSHASMFTGKYPMEHHVRFNGSNRDFLATSKLMNGYNGTTMAEFLQKEGYSTYGMSGNVGIAPGTGFDRGFDIFTFFDPMGNFMLDNEWSSIKENLVKQFGQTRNEILKNMLTNRNYGNTAKYFIKYLELRKEVNKSYRKNNFPINKSGKYIIDTIQRTSFSQPFFLFINFMEFHEPYVKDFNPQKELAYSLGLIDPSNREMNSVISSYHQESKLADWQLGQIIKFLKDNEIYDNTTVIVTSDHGQSLFEHGFYGHGTYLYDELIKVPLLIKLPAHQRKYSYVNKPFSSIGIFDIIKSLASDGEPAIPDFPFVLSEADGSWKIPNSLISGKSQAQEKAALMDSKRLAIFSNDFKLVLRKKQGETAMSYDNIEFFSRAGQRLENGVYKETLDELLDAVNILRWN